jgi:cytochrome c556
MPFKSLKALAGVTALVLAAGSATAGEFDNQIAARQAQMKLYAFNIGQLGAMAKGAMPYDAAVAQGAADNLAKVSSLDASQMWPGGSDNGANPNSYAKADIWANFPDVMAKSKTMGEAVAAMQAAAGKDLDSLRGAIGALGGSCQGCHKAYRVPKE